MQVAGRQRDTAPVVAQKRSPVQRSKPTTANQKRPWVCASSFPRVWAMVSGIASRHPCHQGSMCCSSDNSSHLLFFLEENRSIRSTVQAKRRDDERRTMSHQSDDAKADKVQVRQNWQPLGFAGLVWISKETCNDIACLNSKASNHLHASPNRPIPQSHPSSPLRMGRPPYFSKLSA